MTIRYANGRATTALKEAKAAQASMRRYSTHGPVEPPDGYWAARARFLMALKQLSSLGLTHQAIAFELGVSRPAVSNWMRTARDDNAVVT
jgi:hypothetical protein